jgi:hypothetical protein
MVAQPAWDGNHIEQCGDDHQAGLAEPTRPEVALNQ